MIDTFNITSPPRLLAKEEEALEAARNSLVAFGKLFLQADFKKSESPAFHYAISDAYLDDTDRKQLAVIIARGHGKTSLTKAFILHKFLFYEKGDPPIFIGWVSASLDKAYSNLEYISVNLEFNERILRYFPPKRGGRKICRTWTKQDIKDVYDNTLVSRSNVKSIRGDTAVSLLGGSQRYNYVILDDIEDLSNTKTYESRDYIKKSVTNTAYPALDERCGRLIFNGTPVNPDSLCQNILDAYNKAKGDGREDEYSWRVIIHKATQPNMEGGVLWNSYIPRESLEKKRKFYIDTYGSDSGYYQEYELEPQGIADRIWTRDHYQFHKCQYLWEDDQSWLNWSGSVFPVNCFLGSDPATDIDTRAADDSVVMIVAMDDLYRIFVLEYMAERAIPFLALRDPATGELLGPIGIVDYLLEMYDNYHCLHGTIEDVGMTRGVWQDIESEKLRLGRWHYSFRPEAPGGKEKLNKIRTGIGKFFSHRQVYLREEHYKLREQIEGMGVNLPHDDVIESFFFSTRDIYPPNMKKEWNKYVKKVVKSVKSWVVA